MIQKQAFQAQYTGNPQSSDMFVNMRLNELLKKEHESQIRNRFVFGIQDSYFDIDTNNLDYRNEIENTQIMEI